MTSPFQFRRPLVSIETAKAVLDSSEDDVLALCESGKIRYAFDFKRANSHRRTVRILSLSLIDCANLTETQPPDIGGVIRYVLPGSSEVISLAKLGRQFNCSGSHLAALLQDSCFVEIAKAERAPKESRAVTRTSAAKFLESRRFV
jgi:hypothetical protein